MADGATAENPGRPRMTAGMFLTALGLAIAFAMPVVDPLLLTLNLSKVTRSLNVPSGQVGFLASVATLVAAAAVLAIGNLGDTYGLKRLLIVGLIAHIGVQLLAAMSPNYPFLLAMRFADGFALTALSGLSLALLTVSVPTEIRPIAIGIFMATDAILFGVSPLAGGWVVGAFGWRGLFVVSPLLAAIGLILTARYATESTRQHGNRLDIVGVCLFGVALLGLIYGVGAAQNGLASPQAWLPLVGSALALAAFVRHERQTETPALELTLFARPAFVVAVLVVLIINVLCAGFSVVLGQFGSVMLGLSAETIGLLYLPGTLVLAAVSILAGHMVAKYTARPVLFAGLLVLAVSGLVMAIAASPAMALWILVLATWLLNFGTYLASTSASDVILSYATPEKAGAVAAMRSTFGTAGYALGPAVYIALLNMFFHRRWLADAHSRGLSAQQAGHAVDAVRTTLANSPGISRFDPNLVQQASGLRLDWDFTNAVRLTMLAVTLLPIALSVVTYFVMPRQR